MLFTHEFLPILSFFFIFVTQSTNLFLLFIFSTHFLYSPGKLKYILFAQLHLQKIIIQNQGLVCSLLLGSRTCLSLHITFPKISHPIHSIAYQHIFVSDQIPHHTLCQQSDLHHGLFCLLMYVYDFTPYVLRI